MKTILLVVGKTIEPHFAAGISDYVKRIGRYLTFDMEVIPELKNTRNLTEEVQREKEGELILKALQPGDTVVLLDEGGKEMRSIEFADYMKRKMNTVNKRLVFIIGGPYGFSPKVYAAAQEKISLSRMTFSHQMVRLIFVEQLYRANLPLAHDVLPPDGTPHLRGATLQGHDHPERKSLSPRMKAKEYSYERDTWKPLLERVMSTKRAREFGAWAVSSARIRKAASGSLATIYK